MTVDLDDQTYMLLDQRLDRLAELADALHSSELVWAYWWQVFSCLLALPTLRWMSVDRVMLETTSVVLLDLSRL